MNSIRFEYLKIEHDQAETSHTFKCEGQQLENLIINVGAPKNQKKIICTTSIRIWKAFHSMLQLFGLFKFLWKVLQLKFLKKYILQLLH